MHSIKDHPLILLLGWQTSNNFDENLKPLWDGPKAHENATYSVSFSLAQNFIRGDSMAQEIHAATPAPLPYKPHGSPNAPWLPQIQTLVPSPCDLQIPVPALVLCL